MKIAITATSASLDAQVDPRFGRCPCFLVIDMDGMDFEAVENPNVALGGGAGIQSAQLMAEKGVKYVLTGNCGPNAHQTLSAAGIQIIVGCSGVVREVVEQFKAGGLNVAGAPNVVGHFGMAGAPQDQRFPPQQGPMPGGRAGMDRGMGIGRGGGRGMGRGRGMGMGAGFLGVASPWPQQPLAQDLSKEDELTVLRQQAEVMAQGLQEIQERIRQLEKEVK